MTEAATTPQEPFEVGDLVRIKPKVNVAPRYHLKVDSIVRINPKSHYPNIVSIEGRKVGFADNELEKIWTIDEAIAELNIWLVSPSFRHSPHGQQAIKLGIEALKRIKSQYDPDHQMMRIPLPGETLAGSTKPHET